MSESVPLVKLHGPASYNFDSSLSLEIQEGTFCSTIA